MTWLGSVRGSRGMLGNAVRVGCVQRVGLNRPPPLQRVTHACDWISGAKGVVMRVWRILATGLTLEASSREDEHNGAIIFRFRAHLQGFETQPEHKYQLLPKIKDR